MCEGCAPPSRPSREIFDNSKHLRTIEGRFAHILETASPGSLGAHSKYAVVAMYGIVAIRYLVKSRTSIVFAGTGP